MERRHDMEELRTELTTIRSKVETMEQEVASIKELLQAWENAKGFIKVIEILGKITKALLPTIAFIGAFWYLITSGHWPKQ